MTYLLPNAPPSAHKSASANQFSNFLEPDLNEAARAADASREAHGAMFACRLR
jgi:hypothetical protein